jgi:RNA polymerase sigma-70 factor (ECF subfamily)
MPDGPTEFADLLALGRAGDPLALAQLAEQYEAKVRVVAHVLLGPALRPYLDSLDLVQSVHRSLMVGLRQSKYDISTPDNLIALALLMIRRKVARQWRHLQRQKRLDGRSGETNDLSMLLSSLSSPEPDPAKAAQFNDAVRRLCNSLDASERRMLDLRVQGYSSAEIAQDLGLHPIALRVRMTRLRQRLESAGVLHDWL